MKEKVYTCREIDGDDRHNDGGSDDEGCTANIGVKGI